MSNQKRLEEYLVGNKEKKELGYLKSDISNGKVIMLSGKWGSGKTHFWKNKIEENLKKEKIPNNYISLYGKTSIEEIKNEVFLKIFESVDSFELEEKGTKLAKNTVDLISLFTKSVGIDLSKFTDKPFENFQKMLDDKKLKKTEEYLNSGAIICFDDFERKSKDIDLNDLLGFITQLTLNFSCKVVIILNDDVFEGEEKKIFSNVKEKSVSKFLKYEPKIEELFDLIFNLEIEKDSKKEKKYKDLVSYKEIILKTIEETQELNARIYIQVLDNLVEWIGNNQEIDNNILRCLILVNILFINFHKIVYFENYKAYSSVVNLNESERKHNIEERFNLIGTSEKFIKLIKNHLRTNLKYSKVYPLVEEFKNMISKEEEKELVDKYILELKVLYFAYTLDINNNINNETFQKINNFIETGILINE